MLNVDQKHDSTVIERGASADADGGGGDGDAVVGCADPDVVERCSDGLR